MAEKKKKALQVKQPSTGDYLSTLADMLVVNPRNSPAATLGGAAYDYVTRSTPRSVVRDIRNTAQDAGDWLRKEGKAIRAAPITESLRLLKAGYIDPLADPYRVFKQAATERSRGNEAGGAKLAAMVPLSVAGVLPQLRGTGKLATKAGVEAAETAATKAATKGAEKKVAATATKKASTPKPTTKPTAADSSFGVMPLEDSNLISTRRPNEKSFEVFGNPDEVLLTQTGDAMRLNPKAFTRNMDLLTDEPFMADMKGRSPDEIYAEGVRRGADNLKFIAQDLMDPDKAVASAEWYPSANRLGREFAAKIDQPPEAGYAGLAATSPQTPWPVNVARVDRMSQMMGDDFGVDAAGLQSFLRQQEAMQPDKRLAPVRRGLDYVDQIANSDFAELTDPMDIYSRIVLADKSRFDPRVLDVLPTGEYGGEYGAMTWGNSRDLTNALSMMQDPSMANIRRTLTGGGKVPSFYDDIADPNLAGDIITADTHSTGATGLYPAGANDTIATRGMGSGMTTAATGSKGYYGLISDAHNLAAKELGIPRGNAVQSITWEGVRDLWGSNAKTEALKKSVEDIWRTSSSPDEARFRVADLMGRPVKRVFSVK
jgi:hypothetical protein